MLPEVERRLANARRELDRAEWQFRLWSEIRAEAEAEYAAALDEFVWARERSGRSAARGAQVEAEDRGTR